MAQANRYVRIIERIFLHHHRRGRETVAFSREEIARTAKELGIELPKNLGDLIYSFRYRADLPASVAKRAPAGKSWIIRPAGRSRYQFVAVRQTAVTPSPALAETKVPDATPGIIAMYALSDEQSLLAKVRYNRLIDIFTGVACYSLQSHLRTSVKDLGQVETDEIYVGVDRRGAHYVFPVQAKGRRDRLGIVQMEQDLAMCRAKFPALVCRPVAAQFMEANLIALLAFEEGDSGLAVAAEKHYRLVDPGSLTPDELATYRLREPGE